MGFFLSLPDAMKFLIPTFLMTAAAFADEAKVLLVSPPELKEAWTEYSKMRGEQGTPMKVVGTDEIGKKYEERDLQNKIRLCVREHVEKQGFETVVLGGGQHAGWWSHSRSGYLSQEHVGEG